MSEHTPSVPRMPFLSRGFIWGPIGAVVIFMGGMLTRFMSPTGRVSTAPDRVLLAVGGAALLLGFYVIVIRRCMARRPATAVVRRTAVPELLTGAAVGGAFIALVFGVIVVLGGFLLHTTAGPGAWLVFVIVVDTICVGMTEELAFRGCILQPLWERFGWGWGVLGSAVLFGAAHGNSAWFMLAITLEAGVLLGVLYVVTRSMWFVIGLHAAWNTVSTLLGATSPGTEGAQLLDVETAGPIAISGGEQIGIEASVVTVVIGLLVASLVLVIAIRRGNLGPAFRRPAVDDVGVPAHA